MKRDQAIEILARHRGEFRTMGIVSLALFGSVARDEATDKSDVDVMIELDPERHIGLFGFIGIQQRLAEILGVSKVDLVVRDCLYEEFRDAILEEAIRVA